MLALMQASVCMVQNTCLLGKGCLMYRTCFRAERLLRLQDVDAYLHAIMCKIRCKHVPTRKDGLGYSTKL